MENNINKNIEQVSTGSDVEMIEVNTPSFFERHFLHLLTIFGAGFLIFTFIFQIYYTPIYIVGRSMQPTINKESTSSTDYTHCDLVYYQHKSDYAKNDIVIVDASEYLSEQTDPIIKRVIATSGDTLTFNFYQVNKSILTLQNLHVYKCYYTISLNGQLLEEDYINEQTCFLEIKTNSAGEFVDSSDYKFLNLIYSTLYTGEVAGFISIGNVSYTLQSDEVFICGDNRNNSTDSRYFGAIKTTYILGSMAIHVPYGSNLFVVIWNKIFS